MRKWRIEDSAELYNTRGWGIGYFGINEKGNVTVSPLRERGPAIDLKDVVDELALRDTNAPVLLRFPDILDNRIEKISQCFDKAGQEFGFKAKSYNVYPIKVNQQRPVLEEMVRHGKKFNIGLEAGSKPELHAVLSIMDNPESLIICNGYKDAEFIELALLAQKMGKRMFIVVEKLNELKLIRDVSRSLNVKPNVGMRVKLASSGSGKWEESGGDQSKFGLNSAELLEAVEFAKQEGMEDSLKMIHFHLGSQITNIRKIKAGLREAAQFYVQLRQMGVPVEYVDVGGGLGVDYDGTRSTNANSVNYSIQEYANDVVYSMVSAADKADLPHPNVVAESGRALTAHHSVLIFNVLETTALPQWNEADFPVAEDDHETVRELHTIYRGLSNNGVLEAWHDAVQLREDVLDGFNLGIIDLKTRAMAERLFWSIVQKLHRLAGTMKNPPFELQNLSKLLAEKYFCNFSLFQSLPDAWAIDQIFPIMPIHRLDEEPTAQVTLQDITCDSDGQIDHFIHSGELSRSVPLHPLRAGESYYLGTFLVGAYQEILGDLHNLFGDTNAVHVVVDPTANGGKGGKGGYRFEQIIDGESVADVLDYVQFSAKKLVRDMETWVSASVKEGKITLQEGKEFLAIYRSGLYGYTYLE